MPTRCYAQRILNPYRGVMHIIDMESAEAVTTDGLHWDMYIHDDSLLSGNETRHDIEIPDIKFGTWSATEGLKRAPVLSTNDYEMIQHLGEMLLDNIMKYHLRVPFQFHDTLELWLLDQANQLPLALLESVCEAVDIPHSFSSRWTTGMLCGESFVSTSGVDRVKSREPAKHADYINRLICSRAGNKASVQWFNRQRDESGIGMHGQGLAAGLEGRCLTMDNFPPLMISEHWGNSVDAEIIQDFLDWQAPWLLFLPGLSTIRRRGFEMVARRHCQHVAEHFRLYPVVVDEAHINAARIEARLRMANEVQSEAGEDEIPIYYIEI